MFVCIGVNMFFDDRSRLRTLTEPKVVSDGRVVDNTLLRHVFSAVVLPARAWHVLVVPIGLTLASAGGGLVQPLPP